MKTVETTPAVFHEGNGRTQVSLSINRIGEDLIVCLFNEAGHIGAAAVAEYCEEENRASVSVITCRGHMEDDLASDAARKLCRAARRQVCVIAGIHLDGITKEEISEIIVNCGRIVAIAINKTTGNVGGTIACS